MWRVKLQLTSFVVDRGRVEGEEIRFVHGPHVAVLWGCRSHLGNDTVGELIVSNR